MVQCSMYLDVSFLVNACQVLPDFTTNVSMWLVPSPHICAGPLHEVSAAVLGGVDVRAEAGRAGGLAATLAMIRTVLPST